MEEVYKKGMTGDAMRKNGKIIREMEKAHLHGLTGNATMENG